MTKEQVTDAVLDAIEDRGVDRPELDDMLIHLGLDNIDMVEISLDVEDSLDCDSLESVFDEVLKDVIGTVRDLIDAICKYLKI